MSTMADRIEVGEFGVITFVIPMPLPAVTSATASMRYHPPGSPIEPCMHPHGKYHLSEERLTREIVEKKMEPWQRVPSAMYNAMVYRAGDLRDIYDDTEVQKSYEERRAAMERLEIIKNARGPMLRSQLVAEVCEALLAAGSAKGYTFHKVADAPGPSSSSSVPTQAVKDRTVNRSQGHLSVCVLNLGNGERSRKRSTPQCFHHLIEEPTQSTRQILLPEISFCTSFPISALTSCCCRRPALFASSKRRY